MKLNKLFQTFALPLLAVLFVACSSDDPKLNSLYMGFESCEIPYGRETYFPVLSGNGDYTVTVADPDILKAQPDVAYGLSFGVINVTALKKGSTTLTVTDNKAQESRTLKVKVTDNYLCCFITESNHPALSKGRRMYLMNREDKVAYFYEEMQRDYTFPLITRSRYDFALENNIPYLVLTYADLNGQFTDADIAPTSHRFDLSDNLVDTFNFIESILDVDLDELTDNSLSIAPVYIKMKEEGTGLEIVARFDSEPMPSNMYE